MQPKDYDDFVMILGATAELLAPTRPLSNIAIGMWWNVMKPYDLPAVRQAFDRHMHNPDSGQFMPKPADILKMMTGSTQDSALAAWSKVDKAVRQVGTWESVAFDDALIHRVLEDMGGWTMLGMKTDHDWPFVAKEFENRYRGYRIRNETPEYPPVLIGLAQAQNAQENRESQAPVLIGDATTAARVMQGGTAQPRLGFERASAGDVALLAAPEQRAA
ncbi:DUF6475 domain-containing protein [Pusillimonas noertemannii]|uniref:DUF6475 domain-containing protein n=1 Tax=Pusillimonas noertemannii TaxID=305977 RepID=A0A2U1CMF8_9BURK|nr:DUF6475 domain-containing protein [Pusillimonas noertemannii]NYT68782.1 hypothetical protein [Pusillimonas noertemannii]PVY62195.1 hypothetical protein C7440_1688 [Pusillimonas noertemannii]TFL10819.1 hypothetical protein CSC72_09915 [Pusillimonas noertemannii]